MKKTPIIFLAILTLILFVKLLLPYYSSSIWQWDSAGHASSALFVKENLFPHAIAWHQDAYLGFPHNQFYPPLFSYLVAALSFIFTFEISFKLVVSLSVLLLPLAFYTFARSLELTENQSILFSILSIIFLSLPSNFYAQYQVGGNFDSLFLIGLVANAFAFPILLFYMSSVPKIKKHFSISTILLALLVLSHAFTAIIGILYSLSFPIANLLQKKKISHYIKHYLLAFLLTAFWSLPFLAKRKFSQMAFIPFQTNFQFIISILLLCALLTIFFHKKNYEFFPIGIFAFLLLLFVAITHFFFLAFHTYRFLLIIYLLCILLLSKLIKPNKIILILSLIFLILTLNHFTNFSLLNKSIENPIYYNSSSRTLTIKKFLDSQTPQTLEHLLPTWNNNQEVHYLFIESSLHGDEINTLKKLISNNAHTWGIRWNSVNRDKIPSRETNEYITKTLNLFGIKNIITPIQTSNLNCTNKTISYESNSIIFSGNEIYKLQNNKLTKITTEKINHSDIYFKEILYDEFILCNNSNFLFLRKNQWENQDTYSFISFNQSEIFLATDKKLNCANLQKFPAITNSNYTYYSKFTNIPLIKIIEEKEINYTRTTQPVSTDYYLCEFPTPEIIEPIKTNLTSKPLNQKKWNEFIYNWFLSENFSENLYVNSNKNFTINPNATISEINIQREKISFDINSQTSAPILIKISYFPNWKAYSNNKKIPIYQISPHLMLIYTNGSVTLKYQKLPIDWLGIALTLLGLIFLLRNIKIFKYPKPFK